jgi:hypothetical protein
MVRFDRASFDTREAGLGLRLPAHSAGWALTGLMIAGLAASLYLTGRALPGIIVAVLLAQALPRRAKAGDGTLS